MAVPSVLRINGIAAETSDTVISEARIIEHRVEDRIRALGCCHKWCPWWGRRKSPKDPIATNATIRDKTSKLERKISN